MDISFWTDLNPTLRLVDTTKLFYKKYLYKLKIHAPGFNRYLREKKPFFSQHLLLTGKKPALYISNNQIHFNQLMFLTQEILNKKFKTRIEGDFLSLYSNDIEEFKDIAEKFKKIKLSYRIWELHCPPESVKENLLNGEILVKQINPNFKYKIIFKGGSRKPDFIKKRTDIYNYIYNVDPDEIGLPKNFSKTFLHSRYWFNSTHLYCSDERIITFLQLLAADQIHGIFKLVRS